MATPVDPSLPGAAVSSALDAFRPGAVQSAPKSTTVTQAMLAQMTSATGAELARPRPPRRLVSHARVDTPCLVDASGACEVYLGAPVFVHTAPGATLERLIVALPAAPPRAHKLCVAHMARLRATRVDIDVPSGPFVTRLIEALVAGADGGGRVDIHVHGTAFTRSFVASWMFMEAVRNPAIMFNSAWQLSANASVHLEPLAYRAPLWVWL
jgi:hypothetical protein